MRSDGLYSSNGIRTRRANHNRGGVASSFTDWLLVLLVARGAHKQHLPPGMRRSSRYIQTDGS